MNDVSFPRLKRVKIWFAASRPHTLSASVVPVMVGGALAGAQGAFSWPLFGLTLVGALLVQIGANFTDEYADHGATASAHKYLAPHKVISRELLSERAVRWGAVSVFALATLIGAYLVWRTGWELLLLCVMSLAVAFFYSAGPWPLGDLALGEPLVFLMMGPVMVVGTVYVQTARWEAPALWFSLPVGALVTAILMANNLRDAEEDRRNNRNTLVTVFGAAPVRRGYYALVGSAYLSPLVAVVAGWNTPWVLLPWLTLPLAMRVGRRVRAEGQREVLHGVLKGTSGLHVSFGLLLAAGLLMEAVFRGVI